MAAGVFFCALLAACEIDEPEPTVARFRVTWSVDGGDCESLGAATVRVNMMSNTDQLADEFACTDGGALTYAVEPGVAYSVQLVAEDPDGEEVGRSEARTASVPRAGQTVEVPAFVITPGSGG